MIKRKFWAPIAEVMEFLTDRLPPNARVLELGPGTQPFKRADVYVDCVDVDGIDPNKLVKLDVATQRLPFEDKSFDFVICRHMLEDMYNPFPVCAEMSRVAKSGYVETPSPVAEICRGVDGKDAPYRGYHHHRFIVWECNGELKFLTKYPFIEHMTMNESPLIEALNHSAIYWNTYYLWDAEIRTRHIQSPVDYDINTRYHKFLDEAVISSVKSADTFVGQLLKVAA